MTMDRTRQDVRTALRGFAGRVNLNRNAGVWRVNAALWAESPGFDSNALGFSGSPADRAGGHAVLLWQKPSPTRYVDAIGQTPHVVLRLSTPDRQASERKPTTLSKLAIAHLER